MHDLDGIFGYGLDTERSDDEADLDGGTCVFHTENAIHDETQSPVVEIRICLSSSDQLDLVQRITATEFEGAIINLNALQKAKSVDFQKVRTEVLRAELQIVWHARTFSLRGDIGELEGIESSAKVSLRRMSTGLVNACSAIASDDRDRFDKLFSDGSLSSGHLDILRICASRNLRMFIKWADSNVKELLIPDHRKIPPSPPRGLPRPRETTGVFSGFIGNDLMLNRGEVRVRITDAEKKFLPEIYHGDRVIVQTVEKRRRVLKTLDNVKASDIQVTRRAISPAQPDEVLRVPTPPT